ncbi:MAG: hypothetical protein AB1896_21525 [Thermodesulfobacteriota bacterium]
MVRKDEIRVGAEIDAHCTRCRMVTNHRVVAMVEGVVKRVICLTCQGQHNFRPPPGEKRPRRAKVVRQARDGRPAAGTKSSRPLRQWTERKEALDPASHPRTYALSADFDEGETLEHPTFGLGFVLKKIGSDKIEVLFEKEVKVLVVNR